MQTQINQAQIKAPVVINEAEAKTNSTLVTNEAQMESFLKITKNEAESYGKMKGLLGMKTDEEFLKYMRVKTINQFNQKNLIIGVNPTVEINTKKKPGENQKAQEGNDDKPRLLKEEEEPKAEAKPEESKPTEEAKKPEGQKKQEEAKKPEEQKKTEGQKMPVVKDPEPKVPDDENKNQIVGEL